MQHAAALVPIHRTEFRESHRQIAIATQLRLVNQDVPGTIHRLQLILGLFHFHRAKHVVLVIAGVAAGVPQIATHDMRRVNQIVAALDQFVAQPGFNDVANEAALGMPEDQAGAGFFLNTEEIELRAKFAVIAALGFFQSV